MRRLTGVVRERRHNAAASDDGDGGRVGEAKERLPDRHQDVVADLAGKQVGGRQQLVQHVQQAGNATAFGIFQLKPQGINRVTQLYSQFPGWLALLFKLERLLVQPVSLVHE